MNTPNVDLSELLAQAGFKRRSGASPNDIARVADKFGFELPDEFLQLWLYSDGMTGGYELTGGFIDIMPLAEIEKYAGVFEGGLDCIPFGDCNDSNPYVICTREPLRGYVVHLFHDGDTVLTCRGLRRFLELVAAARAGNDEDAGVDHITGDFAFEFVDRTNDDAVTARELVRIAGNMEPRDWWRGTTLRFAAQLFGPGHEGELANVMAVGDEYTRQAVLKRWRGLRTPKAQELLRKDEADYQAFLVELRTSLETAGIQVETDRHGCFRVGPERSGLNLVMLFAQCRQPGKMGEWVQTFVKRQRERQ